MFEIVILIVVIITAFIAVAWYARYSSQQRKRTLGLDLDHVEPEMTLDTHFNTVFEQELQQQSIGDIDSEPAVSLSADAEMMMEKNEPIIRLQEEPVKQQTKTEQSTLNIVIDDDLESMDEVPTDHTTPPIPPTEYREPTPLQSPPPRKESDDLVIALTIMAPDNARFSGKAVKAVLDSLDLHFGDLQIYHRYTAGVRKQSIFSVANILDPGTLLPDQFISLTTPGLLIFSRLPGPVNGLTVFDDLLDTAHIMTEKLGGTLCDDGREPISPARLEAMRSRIFNLNFALHTEQNNDYSN